ncbi:MAG: hypothetical protein LBV77_05185 [Candidatus Adiutrix intracellularis]|nr:hypothetical protein [Candidatus Adiutrix intracellularis]
MAISLVHKHQPNLNLRVTKYYMRNDTPLTFLDEDQEPKKTTVRNSSH